MNQPDLFLDTAPLSLDAPNAEALPENALRQPLAELAQGLTPEWANLVKKFLSSDIGRHLSRRIDTRCRAGVIVYPHDPFYALRLTPFPKVRVIVVGQDPYHGPGQAHGLAFSVPSNIRFPPSLRNIFKEWSYDLRMPMPTSGNLEPWAHRGVLLLNTTLTVEDGLPSCHSDWGWNILTQKIIQTLAEDFVPKVFLLWGNHAQSLLTTTYPPHLVLKANHPSPLSAMRGPLPFLGCGHFSQAHHFLTDNGFAGTLPFLVSPS